MWHRVNKPLLALCVGLVVLGVASWLALPWWLKGQVLPKVSEALGRQVTVQTLSFRPWRLELVAEGLQLDSAPGQSAEPLLQVERLAVRGSLRSLWHLAPVVASVEIEHPVLRLARRSEGRYSIDDLLVRFLQAPAQPDAKPARFAVYNLQLSDGELMFDDQPVQRRHELKQLRLDLPFLSNLDTDIEVRTEPRLAGRINDIAFDTGASAAPFASKREASLKLHLAPLDLLPYLAYLPQALPVQIQQGRVATDLQVDFVQAPKAQPEVRLKGQVSLQAVHLAHRDGEALLAFDELRLGLRDVQPLRQQAKLDELRWTGPKLALRRLASGELKLPQAQASPTSAAPAAAPSGQPNPWRVSLDRFSLSEGQLTWQDDGVKPAQALQAKSVALELKDLSYPISRAGSADYSLQLERLLSKPAAVKVAASNPGKPGEAPVGSLKGSGQWAVGASPEAGPAQAEFNVQLSELPLAWLNAYVQAATPLSFQGQLNGEAKLLWVAGAEQKAARSTLSLSQLSVDNLIAKEAGAEALSFRRLALADAVIDLDARQVQLGSVQLQAPQLRLERNEQGVWNVSRWSKAAAPVQALPAESPDRLAAAATPPWGIRLAGLQVAQGRVDFNDALTGDGVNDQPVRYLIDGLRFDAQDLTLGLAAAKPAPVLLQAKLKALRPGQTEREVAEFGTLEWRGSVNPQSAAAQGTLRLDRLPLHGLDAYLERALRVDLRRAELGYRGDFKVAVDPELGLRASATGDVLLGDLKLAQRSSDGPGADLLSWQALTLKGFKLSVVPGAAPQLEIGELSLNDFFAKLSINEQGRFNLGEVTVAQVAVDSSSAAASAASAATSAASAAATAPVVQPALQWSVGSTRLLRGRVDFNDRFVRPNYSADISNLQGSLGAFSSASKDMAPLDLRGTVAGTGLLEISGKLNPGVKPLMLDINARASDLELAPLSPYAAKYAGYAIERGKLSMDVSYRVQADGRLEASNQLILNQLTFGERVESPDATKLPVLLAVALLKDSNGVIDVRLPISGSLDDPQFSVSGIVFKLIVNLLGKALMSPFSLLSGGEGQDLSYAEFLPGTALLNEQGRATLAKVAKALQDRPALSMTVTGAADFEGERLAIQRADLEQRLQAERRRELQRTQTTAGTDAASAEQIALSPADRERLLRSLYKSTEMAARPRNLIGLLKDVPLAQMEAMLMAHHAVTVETGRALALARGVTVRDALIAQGLPNARLFLAAPKLHAADSADEAWTPRVVLSLQQH